MNTFFKNCNKANSTTIENEGFNTFTVEFLALF